MCGRYSLSSDAYDNFLQLLGIADGGMAAPDRYNIAPMQPVPVVRLKGSDRDRVLIANQELPEREIALMQWGLVPAWAKEMPKNRPLINARSETIADKPSFRGPFRRRKCLVPADGFYEWKRGRASPAPYHCCLPDRAPFAFAAIWDIWMGPHGEDWLESVSLVTKAATPLMTPVHHRSPVIVDPADYDLWLRPNDPPARTIFQRLGTDTESRLRLSPVDGYVNNARHDGAACIAPARGSQFDLF